jgi:hypothetical protein
METINTSPSSTPAGLLMVIEPALSVVTVAVVADPRWAICANTSCPSSSPSTKINVFTEVVSGEEGKRNVPMMNKKLVFSSKFVANILQLVD